MPVTLLQEPALALALCWGMCLARESMSPRVSSARLVDW
jgi:hypothetical protein